MSRILKPTIAFFFLFGFLVIISLVSTLKSGPKSALPNIPNQSSGSITYIPSVGNPETIIIDFSTCSPGRELVVNPFGHTYFVFEGIKSNNCIFYYGVNFENPKGGSGPYTECIVPVSLGQQTFENYGTKRENIESYCIKP